MVTLEKLLKDLPLYITSGSERFYLIVASGYDGWTAGYVGYIADADDEGFYSRYFASGSTPTEALQELYENMQLFERIRW